MSYVTGSLLLAMEYCHALGSRYQVAVSFLGWATDEAQLATYTMLPSPFFECGFRHGPDISDQYGFNEEDLDDSDCD